MESRNFFAASDTGASLSFVAIGDSFTERLNDPAPGAAVALASHTAVSARDAWMAARREDARWAKEYFLPWVNRRLHGTSSGGNITPERPDLGHVTT